MIYTENSPALEFLQDRGLLAAVDQATLSATPARYNSPQGRWVGVSARVSVILYNPSLIKAGQLPRSVMQLADPRYKGKLALAAGETDFQPIVTSVLHAHGQAATVRWLQAIKANAAGHIYPDNETITSQVNRGAAALGIINEYYWYRLRAEIGAAGMHSKITYFAPHDPGYVVDVSGAAVLKSSAHQAAAQRFLAFLVSRPAQEIIGRDSLSYEYPIGVRGDHRRAGDTRCVTCSPTRSRSLSWVTARRPSRCCARLACCEPPARPSSRARPRGPAQGCAGGRTEETLCAATRRPGRAEPGAQGRAASAAHRPRSSRPCWPCRWSSC